MGRLPGRCGVPVFLQPCSDGMFHVWQLFEYVAYSFATNKLRSATIASHLSAIKFFHRISRGFELDTTHPVLACALKGAARSHADVSNQATVRRPLSWGMLLAGETLVPSWGTGGRVLWLALCASFCFLTRASELFAETRTRIHETYCLRRADVAFFCGKVQLVSARWSTADRVEVRFRGSKGDQMRKGVVLTRVRGGPPRPVGAGGNAVDLMIELMSCYLFLPSSAPLVAFGTGNGRWSMWTQQQATTALRAVVALAGVRAEEYALHSLRIGGATHLSAGGATPEVLQREGRWASDAYKAYVRSHGKDASWVANVLAQEGLSNGIQPGQGTEWGRVNPPQKIEGRK